MQLQLMPPAVFGLAQPAGLPVGYASLPVLAFLLEFLLTSVVFLWHGSSCDGKNDFLTSQRTMTRRARLVKMGLI
jgi:hypothetical protein